jgi:Leucine-rich repeat (LRR) protein
MNKFELIIEVPSSTFQTEVASFYSMNRFIVDFDDVTSIVASNLSTTFIPTRLSSIFKHVLTFVYATSKVKFISKDNFEGMQNLEKLQLNGNEIEEIPANAFVYVKKLRELDLSNNELKSLDDNLLVRLPMLQVFHANDNDLQEINEELFERNENLKEVALRGNKIMQISMDFSSLVKIERIDLGSNVCIDGCSSKKSKESQECSWKKEDLLEEIERLC